MPREKRNYHEGGIYHIIQRGNNKAYIFDDQTDKIVLLELAKAIKETDPYYMLAYVLMDNHYHFLIEMKETPISNVMHKLNMTYSKYFNKKYKRIGTIFSERYKCFPIETQAQFYKVLQYILFNPVRAGIVKRPDQYRWSSHFEFRQGNPVLISSKRLLRGLAHSDADAWRIYKTMLLTKLDQVNGDWMGNEKIMATQSIDLFFENWCDQQEIRKWTKEKAQSKSVILERNDFIIKAIEQGYKIDEIAVFLNFTQQGVRKIVRQEREQSKSVQQEYTTVTKGEKSIISLQA
ncbi:transposase [Fusibacter sp. 3D3]|uniref:REP-associated tyrosine transposase n=1 Tax=Fusibacter sp. 3D3 TaxID=1048380 RepID=UPI000853C34D|nr:transposase [Fusibacter sp. 3D3]GAU77732.1 hypothetical protein F3D3_2361 [Fusibacter sp. 3D3]